MQTIPLVATPPDGDSAKVKKRKRTSNANANRVPRANKREGSRKSARVKGSSQTLSDENEDEDDEDMDMCQNDDEGDDSCGSPRGSGAHDKEDEGPRALGVNVLRHARLLAERLSLQTTPEAHEQLARVTVETALSLPSTSPEAQLAWGSARALARPLHGPSAGKSVLKQLLPGVLRPSTPAAAVKGVVAFVDSCLAELPPASPRPSSLPMPPPAAPASSEASGEGEKADNAQNSGESDAKAGAEEAAKKDVKEETFEDAVLVLCHQLCVRVGDRAPTRVQVATAVGGLLDALRTRRGAESARLHFENMGM